MNTENTPDYTGINSINYLPLTDEVKYLLDALHEALNNVARLDGKIALADMEYGQRHAEVAVEALEAKGPDGKPIASNDIARRAYMEQATQHDGTCMRLTVQLAELRYDRAQALADAEVLRSAVRLMGVRSAEISG